MYSASLVQCDPPQVQTPKFGTKFNPLVLCYPLFTLTPFVASHSCDKEGSNLSVSDLEDLNSSWNHCLFGQIQL